MRTDLSPTEKALITRLITEEYVRELQKPNAHVEAPYLQALVSLNTRLVIGSDSVGSSHPANS